MFHHRWAIDAILALAPMSPLQAALEVPEVRALVEAAKAVVKMNTKHRRLRLEAALAALEERT